MPTDNPKYNPEGYKDETAYQAIRNTEGFVETAQEDNDRYVPGEIWRTNTGKEVMIMQSFSKHCITFALSDSPGESKICVAPGYYTNVAMPTYTFKTNMETLVARTPDSRFLAVKMAFYEALGIINQKCDPEKDPEIISLREEVASLGALLKAEREEKDRCLEDIMQNAGKIQELEKALEESTNLYNASEMASVKAEAERDVYKGLYDGLVKNVMENAGIREYEKK